MQILLLLLLIAILAALAWCARRDARAYRSFCLFEDSAKRRAFYREWTVYPFLAFWVGGLALLALTGSLEAAVRMPAPFSALRSALLPSIPSARTTGYLAGMAIGAGISVLLWALRSRRADRPHAGEIEPLLPRNGAEIAAVIPLAINAGISEELFFRLALPLVAARVTGSATAGFAISLAAFTLAHWYQGWKGVLSSALWGGILTLLYLTGGTLLQPMLLHVLIDLIALVLRPWIALGLRPHPAAA